MFTAGPPVVKESHRRGVSKEDLGGPAVAIPSGLIHNLAADDHVGVAEIRDYLSYFPSSAWSYPRTSTADDTGPAPRRELLDIVPATTAGCTTCARVLDVVVDDGGLVRGPARLRRRGRCAPSPTSAASRSPSSPTSRWCVAGSVDADAADKAAHFIMVADAFHLPLVFLADNPGVMPGSASERAGVLRSGARMFAAQTQATTPKLHLTLRKAYGFGSMVMAMIAFDQPVGHVRLSRRHAGRDGRRRDRAGPSARTPTRRRRCARPSSSASYRSASGLGFDELIDPRETRDALLHALQRAARAPPRGPGTGQPDCDHAVAGRTERSPTSVSIRGNERVRAAPRRALGSSCRSRSHTWHLGGPRRSAARARPLNRSPRIRSLSSATSAEHRTPTQTTSRPWRAAAQSSQLVRSATTSSTITFRPSRAAAPTPAWSRAEQLSTNTAHRDRDPVGGGLEANAIGCEWTAEASSTVPFRRQLPR